MADVRLPSTIVVVLVLVLTLAALVCTPTPTPAPGELPVLEIATDATFPPFHYIGEDGTPTGFEIELAKLAATRAGWQPVVEVRRYDELLSGLPEGGHDLVAATTGVTPEREALYLFTEPHFVTCQAAVVRTGEGEPVTLEALRGRRVGASGEGTAVGAMRTIDGAEPVALDVEGASPLLDGTVDAIVVDEWEAVELARRSGGRLRVLSEPVALEHYAFVLARAREPLREELDRALAALDEEGEIAALRERFGLARGADWPVRDARLQPP